jgi:hypothetical protein
MRSGGNFPCSIDPDRPRATAARFYLKLVLAAAIFIFLLSLVPLTQPSGGRSLSRAASGRYSTVAPLQASMDTGFRGYDEGTRRDRG